MDLTTSWRHLFSAVLHLGSHEGTIHQRLQAAYAGISRISPEVGLPIHLRGHFDELMLEFGHFVQSPADMDQKSASRLAKKVIALYDKVVKELGK